MSDRVLSTEEAKSAIRDIQRIINGGLTEQLGQLDTNGQKLSQPDVWDGPLATTFRSSTWPRQYRLADPVLFNPSIGRHRPLMPR